MKSKRPDLPGSSEGMVLIHGISRAQARANGELVPLPERALRFAGLEVPVDLTGPLHATIEDADDVKTLLELAVQAAANAGKRDRCEFTFGGRTLVAIIAAGDEGKPEITIGFPEDF
jgi:hypothetical protein